ncbi:MAG: GntR family transcriptional regulator [Verrucomicrobiota bacterium]|nr:GntR family transcriptional regulator [Verrucomicrobiota bacterium]
MKNLFYHIDVYSGLPVYRQLMDQTKHYIASGTLLLGDQLPSIRELSTRLSINPATIVKAYSELQTSGVVEIKQGKGAFVAQGCRDVQGQKLQVGKIARQLAVESQQLGLELEEAQDLLEEEWIRLGREASRRKGMQAH